MEALALAVGFVALPPVAKSLYETWKLLEQARMTDVTRELFRLQLQNERIIFAQWAQQVGLCCPHCVNESLAVNEVQQTHTRSGKIRLTCRVCSRSTTRIACYDRSSAIGPAVQDTLVFLSNLFVWSDEIARAHGLERELPRQQTPAQAAIEPRRLSRSRALIRKMFRRSERSRDVQARAAPSARDDNLQTAKWVLRDEDKFRMFIENISKLIAELKEMTKDVIEASSTYRLTTQVKNWWGIPGNGIRPLLRSKQRRVLAEGLKRTDAVKRVSALMLEQHRRSLVH